MPGRLYTSLPHPPRLGEGQSPPRPWHLWGICVATAALLGLQHLTLWGLKLRPCQTPSGSLQTHTHTRVHAQYACDPAAVTSAPGQRGESAHDTSLPLTAPAGLPAGRGAEASGAAWAGLVPAVREDGHRDLLYSTAGRWRRAWLNTPLSLRFSLCATGMKTPASQRSTET